MVTLDLQVERRTGKFAGQDRRSTTAPRVVMMMMMMVLW